jgi:hypothetical protein
MVPPDYAGYFGVTTFLPPKIPAKKLSFSSMSGNTGKSFRVTREKRFDFPSSEILIRKSASFHVPTPLMHAASASFTSSAVFAREQWDLLAGILGGKNVVTPKRFLSGVSFH